MTPWWVVVVAALAMGVVGHLTGLRLATGGYRIDEDEADHAPGRELVAGPAHGAALGRWRRGRSAASGAGRRCPTYLLFAWLTVGLIWIDLDVHRLPVGLVVPTAWWLVALLVVATVATGEPRWQGALIGAAVMGAIYLVLGVLPGGGVGGGDVRLAPVIGALLGWLGPAHLAVGLMAGFLIGGLGAVALLVLGRAGLKTRSPTARRCASGRGSRIVVDVPDPDLAHGRLRRA